MTQYNNDVDTVFYDICTAIGQNECVLFTGCGLAGQAYVQAIQTSIEYSKHPPSSWRETLTAIFKWYEKEEIVDVEEIPEEEFIGGEKISIDFYHLFDNKQRSIAAQILMKYLEQYLEREKNKVLDEVLEQCFQEILYCYEATPGKLHELIVQLPFQAYLSVSYDMFIEDAYISVNKLRLATFYESSIERAKKWFQTKKDIPFILKLHSDITHPEMINITDRAFNRLGQPGCNYRKNLKTILSNSSILAVGFEESDTDLQDLLAQFKINKKGTNYWIVIPGKNQMSSDFEVKKYESDFRTIIQYKPDGTHSRLTSFFERILQIKSGQLIAPQQEPTTAIHIYISSAQADDGMRKKIEQQLRIIKNTQDIKIEHITAGQETREKSEEYIKKSDIILLLISSDYLDSKNGYYSEMQHALEREKEARVIPILLKPCLFEDAPFSNLKILPKNQTPISGWEDIEEAYLEVNKNIKEVIQEIIDKNAKKRRDQFMIVNKPDSPPPSTTGSPEGPTQRNHYPNI